MKNKTTTPHIDPDPAKKPETKSEETKGVTLSETPLAKVVKERRSFSADLPYVPGPSTSKPPGIKGRRIGH